ncbi:Putative aliphatic sulfonates-binding protein [Acaryochloris thomasi RCC1774]|uniref:Aliphatic sulfonates-binding protein n=1 Tax=Acaryochloris thomasi RCC1774 TaxID=1764569 RepID=A0A2W1J9J6_9CYAN|nr:Putative aliphatic sulfonates-binding protein [Acaryochloris thomasi RCC1774]
MLVLTLSCAPSRFLVSKQTLAPSVQETAQVLQLGCSRDWAGWWPWAIAQEQAFLEANEIKIELQWFDDYYAALAAIAEGTLDANCQVFNDTVEMESRSVNGEVVVLVTDYSSGNDKIIVTGEIASPAALKHKHIGVERGKLTDFLLTLVLEKVGMKRDAVKIEDLSTIDAATAFVAGKLDAIVVWQPDWLVALKRPGSRELFSSKDFSGSIPQVIAVSQTALNQKMDAVQFLVKSWFKSLHFINQNPDLSREIMLTHSQLSDAKFEMFSQGIHLLSVDENIRALTPGNNFDHLGFTAQKAAQFLTEAGLLAEQPNLTTLFDDRPLRAYRQNDLGRES